MCACSVFERFRAILHDGQIDKRIQFVIEGLIAVRRAGFEASGHPAVKPELDLVEAGALTHTHTHTHTRTCARARMYLLHPCLVAVRSVLH